MIPIIRPLRREELAFAAESPALEGWTGETPEIFEGFLEHDPDGCLVAEESGRLAGICVATSYGRDGFIGELIVRREARGRGLGPMLLEAAVHYLRGRGAEQIYLDGVKKAVPFYEFFGFRPICPSLRFAGWADQISRIGGPVGTGAVRPMQERDLPSVFKLDREAFGADRSPFLERRRALHPELAWVVDDEEGIAGTILGYPGNGIIVAGPWVVTERYPRPFDLLGPVLDQAGKMRLRIGVLETSRSAVGFFRSVGGLIELNPSFRMVLGDSDRLGNSPMCWAVGSPAKG